VSQIKAIVPNKYSVRRPKESFCGEMVTERT